MAEHVAMYAHLTRTGESIEAQLHDLLDLAYQSGCEIVATLTDETPETGASSEVAQFAGRVSKPGVAVIVAWTVDQLGRSLQHLVITPKPKVKRAD